ncbi:MAG: sensor domain-containing diguanylate cyclase [Rhodospirillales bacterium]|nr:sensor domain-containing diguanylate cyclase [Rhodospirillales bacterium]
MDKKPPNDLLYTVLNSLNHAVAIIQSNGEVSYGNEAFYSLLDGGSPKTIEEITQLYDLNINDFSAIFKRCGEMHVCESCHIKHLVDERLSGVSKDETVSYCYLSPERKALEFWFKPLPDDQVLMTFYDIRNRATSDYETKEEEQRLKDYATAGADWFWQIDKDFRLNFCTDDLFEFLDVPRKVILGKRFSDFADNHELKRHAEKWKDLSEKLENHKPFKSFEFSIPLNDGRLLHLSLSGVPIFDNSGGFTGYRGGANNVTDRVEAKSYLAQSEKQLRLFLESSPVGASMSSVEDGSMVYCNPRLAEMLGYDLGELFGKRTLEFYADPNARKKMLKLLVENGEAIDQEIDVKKKDGSHIAVSLTLKNAVFKDKDVILAWVYDVSKRVEADRIIRESERRLRDIAESASDWFWEADQEFRATYVSERFLELVGLPAEEVLGSKSLEDLGFISDFDDDDELIKFKAQVIAQKPFSEAPYFLDDPMGNRHYVQFSGKPVFDVKGEFQGYRGAGREVTQLVETQKKLEKAAHFDALTDLPNRRYFNEYILKIVAKIKRNKRLGAMCFLDLDGFKKVNDEIGHDAGDYVLQSVAQRLVAAVRKSDFLARIGGDEFVLVIEEQADRATVEIVVKKVIESISSPYSFDGQSVSIGVSVGIALIDEDGDENAEQVLKRADSAMYKAKKQGKGTYVFDD